MRLLCFLARSFRWHPFERSLAEVGGTALPVAAEGGTLADCVVVFAHAELADEPEAARKGVFQKTLKHVKWLANKRSLRNVVLHSFTHLGAESASPGFARDFLDELAERLRGTGYEVACTPFGHLCEWQLDVFGESLAKVYKQL